MIGVLPQSMFGLTSPTVAPVQQVAQPFTWGRGGSRLSPDDIELQRKLALQNQLAGMDTSPVASWTQGLARVAQALVGNIQNRRLDKAADANAAEGQAALASLGSGGSVAAILANPNVDPKVKEYALAVDKRNNPTPQAPNDFERSLIASNILPGTPEWVTANEARAQNFTDPTVNIPLPGGRVYVGPRSGISAATGGGGPASTGPAAPPSSLPPDFDFKDGGASPSGARTFPLR